MGILGITDIVALAKAGYKPSDVKELLEIEKQDQTKDPEPSPEESAKPDVQPPTENEPKKSAKDQEGTQGKENNIDYKKEYETIKQQLETLQKENTKTDISDNIEKPKSLAEILAEVM